METTYFNHALLSKQGWEFLIDPYSLVAWVYRAIYFPHSSFIHANLGTNPSYIREAHI